MNTALLNQDQHRQQKAQEYRKEEGLDVDPLCVDLGFG